MVARYAGPAVRLCIFDLDHTLVRSPLDLAAMALDMRRLLEDACGPLPAREDRFRVGELLAHCRSHAPALEPALWACALGHERQALGAAALEPGALDAVAGVRRAGWRTALWTNNAREVTLAALERFALLEHFDAIATRDEMPALKPAPDGWHVIRAALGGPGPGATTGGAVVVGDSWVDGLAAAAAGVPFIAYRADAAELARWAVTPVAALTDLAALPAWLAAHH
jgi:phosphoglycolate phosphatase